MKSQLRNKKHISLDEAKSIQLEMLKEIDLFCRINRIRYSLAFGTLLGAIRHKGFIPWDDDVDIMMPLNDLIRFKKLFQSNTLEYCDVDTVTGYYYGFSRIANKKTWNKKGIFRSYGICIDVYPIVPIPNDQTEQTAFWERALKLERRYINFVKWNDRALRYLMIKQLPGLSSAVRMYRDYMLDENRYKDGCNYHVVAGPLRLRNKMTYDFDLFRSIIDVNFENNKFCGIADFDKYLTMRYGDYMQFPPEDQRHPYHGGNYFWL